MEEKRREQETQNNRLQKTPHKNPFARMAAILQEKGMVKRIGAAFAVLVFAAAIFAGSMQEAKASSVLGYTKITVSKYIDLTDAQKNLLNAAGYGGGSLARLKDALYTMTTDSTDDYSHVFCTDCGLHACTGDNYAYTSMSMATFCYNVGSTQFWIGRALKWYETTGKNGVNIGSYVLSESNTTVYIGSLSSGEVRMMIQGYVWGMSTSSANATKVLTNMAGVLGYNANQSSAIASWLAAQFRATSNSGYIYTYTASSCPNGKSISNHQVLYGWKDSTTQVPQIGSVTESKTVTGSEWIKIVIKKTESTSGNAIDTATFEVLLDGNKLNSAYVKKSYSGNSGGYGSYSSSNSTFTTKNGIVAFWYQRTYTSTKSSKKYYVTNYSSLSTYWKNYYTNNGYYTSESKARSAAKSAAESAAKDAVNSSKSATHTWTVTETVPPEGYALPSNPTQTITESSTMTDTSYIGAITVTNSKTMKSGFTFKDPLKYGKISVTKTYDTSVVKTSCSLKGAVYTVYAGEDGIVSYKDKNGNACSKKTYNKGDVITTITTNANGKGTSAACLPCGYTYYVKETSAPTGFEKDTNTYYVKLTYSKSNGTWAVRYKKKTNSSGSWSSSWTASATVPISSKETPVWGYVTVYKRVVDGYGNSTAEKSAEFKVTNSSGTKVATLTYSGTTVSHKDSDGVTYKYAKYTSTTKLPYGTYTVTQTKGTSTAKFHDDGTFKITSGTGETKEFWWKNNTLTWSLNICKRVQTMPTTYGASKTYEAEYSAKFTLYYKDSSGNWVKVSQKTCSTSYTTSGGNTYAKATWTGLKADLTYKLVQTGGSTNAVYVKDITNIKAKVSGHAVSGFTYKQDGTTYTKTSKNLWIYQTNPITWIEICKRYTDSSGTSHAETSAEFELWDETTGKLVETKTTSTVITKDGVKYGWACFGPLNPEHKYTVRQTSGQANTKLSDDVTGIDLSSKIGSAYRIWKCNKWDAGKIKILKRYEEADGTYSAEYSGQFQVINSSGTVVATLTTSGTGTSGFGSATTGWLPLGTYTIHQIAGQENTEFVEDQTVKLTTAGETVQIKLTNTSTFTPTSVEVWKEYSYLETDGTPTTGAEQGAVFKVLYASKVKKTDAQLTAMTASERQDYVSSLGSSAVAATLTTDSDGYAYADLGNLETGASASYVILQVSGKEGYTLSDAESFTLTASGSTKSKTFELVNYKYDTYISIYKKTSETGADGATETSPESGAVFYVLRADKIDKTASELTAMTASERKAYAESLGSSAVAAKLTTGSDGTASAVIDLTSKTETLVILQTEGTDGYALADVPTYTATAGIGNTIYYEGEDQKYETFVSVNKKISETVVLDSDDEDETESETESTEEPVTDSSASTGTVETAEKDAVFYVLRASMVDKTTDELTAMTASEREDYVYGLSKEDIEAMDDDAIVELVSGFLTSDSVAAALVTGEDGTASASIAMSDEEETFIILQTKGEEGYALQDAEEFTGKTGETLEYDRSDPKYEFAASITKVKLTADENGTFESSPEGDVTVFIIRKSRLTELSGTAQDTLDAIKAEGDTTYYSYVAGLTGLSDEELADMTAAETKAVVDALTDDEILELEMLSELTSMTLTERLSFVAGLLGTTLDAMENMTGSEIKALVESDTSNVAAVLITEADGTDTEIVPATAAEETFFLLQTSTLDGYSYNDAESFTYVYGSDTAVVSDGSETDVSTVENTEDGTEMETETEAETEAEEESGTSGIRITLEWQDIEKLKTVSVTKTKTDINGENEEAEKGAEFTILYLENADADAEEKAKEISAYTYAGARKAYIDGLNGESYVFWGELPETDIAELSDEQLAEYYEEEEQSKAAYAAGVADAKEVTVITTMTTDSGGSASASFAAATHPNTFLAYQTDGEDGYELLDAIPSTDMEVDDSDEYNVLYSFTGKDKSTMYAYLGVIKYYDTENGDENDRWEPEEGATFNVLLDDGTIVATITTGADGYGYAVDTNGDKVKFPVETGTVYIIHQTGGAANHEYAEDEEVYFAKDQDHTTVYYECKNPSNNTKMILTKVSADTGTEVSGAEYTIYAAEDIYGTNGSLLYSEGDVVDTITTGQYSASDEVEGTEEEGIEGTEEEAGTDDGDSEEESEEETEKTYEDETAGATEGSTWCYIPYGSYYIYETGSPLDYVQSTLRTDLTITANGITYQTEGEEQVTAAVKYTTSGIAYVEVGLSDQPVYGSIYIDKDGTVLTNADVENYSGFTFTTEGIGGASYAVYAAEDITNDAGELVKYVDPDDGTVKEMKSGALLGYVTTNDEGYAQFTWVKVTDMDVAVGTNASTLLPDQYETTSDFYLGNYTVKEVETPYGRALDETEYLVTLAYDQTAASLADDGTDSSSSSADADDSGTQESFPYRSSGPYILETAESDDHNGGFNAILLSLSDTITSVDFTTTVMTKANAEAAGYTCWDVSADQDGTVILWVNGTTAYVSTNYTGQFVYLNARSAELFSGCSFLTSITFENVDTSLLVDASNMFYRCSGLTELDLSMWDTSNVMYVSKMFEGCTKLVTIYAAEVLLKETDESDVTETCITATANRTFMSEYTSNDETVEADGFSVEDFDFVVWMETKALSYEFGGTIEVSNSDVASITLAAKDTNGDYYDTGVTATADSSNAEEWVNDYTFTMTVCITFSETGSYGEYDPAYVTVTVECPDKIEINAVYTEHPEATVGTTNDAQTLEIQVDKVDQNGNKVEGATFGLYANCTILDGDGNVLFHAGDLIQTAVSGDKEYGAMQFTNLPSDLYAKEGTYAAPVDCNEAYSYDAKGDLVTVESAASGSYMYYVVELSAPSGYKKADGRWYYSGDVTCIEGTATKVLTYDVQALDPVVDPELDYISLIKAWDDTENLYGARPEWVVFTVTLDSRGKYILWLSETEAELYYYNTTSSTSGAPAFAYLTITHSEFASQYTSGLIGTWDVEATQRLIDGTLMDTWEVTLDTAEFKTASSATYSLDPEFAKDAGTWKFTETHTYMYTADGTNVGSNMVSSTGTGYTTDAGAWLDSDTQNVWIATNKYERKDDRFVDAQFTKYWADYSNEENLRPDSITVVLYRESIADGVETVGEYVLDSNSYELGDVSYDATGNNGNTWVLKITKLDRYADEDNTDEYTYWFSEVSATWGSKTYDVEDGSLNGTYTVDNADKSEAYNDGTANPDTMAECTWYSEVTNTYGITIGLSITKTWDTDDENAEYLESVTFTIRRYSTEVSDEEAGTITMTADDATAADTWVGTVTGLEKYDSYGNAYTYYVEEEPDTAGSFTVSYSGTVEDTSTGGYKATVVNTDEKPETVESSVAKSWDDNGQTKYRPDGIYVRLIAEGKNIGTVTYMVVELNESNDWKYTATNLPKYDDDAKTSLITYSWEELYDGDVATVSTKAIDSLLGVKTADLKEDEDISISYTYSGTDKAEITGGTDETEGYVTSYSYGSWTDNGYELTTVINTYRQTTEVSVTKEWVLDGKAEKTDAVYVKLVSTVPASGGLEEHTAVYKVVQLDKTNNWSETVSGLPAFYTDGREIEYTWEECYAGESVNTSTSIVTAALGGETATGEIVSIPDDGTTVEGLYDSALDEERGTYTEDDGWTATYETDGTETTLTNTKVRTTEISVEKVWDDNDNEGQTRPDTLYVALVATFAADDGDDDGATTSAVYKVITLTADNNWKYTETGLPVYDTRGKEITYSWAECYAGQAVSLEPGEITASLGQGTSDSSTYTVPDGTIAGYYDMDSGTEYGMYDAATGYRTTYNTDGAATTITNSLSRTGSITVKKLDADGNSLSGVEFTLYAASTMTDTEASAAGITQAGQEYTEGGVTYLTAYSGGTWYIYGGTGQVRTTGTDGTVSWEDLEAGSYVVKETKAADGYTLLADALCIDLPLTVSDEEVSEKGYDTSGENTVHLKSKGQWLFYDLTYEVTDGWNLNLPSTGWKGMVPAAVTVAGLAIVAAAMAVTLRRKKGNRRKSVRV